LSAKCGSVENKFPVPHLEQFLVQSNNFLLEDFGSNLLSERRWLHGFKP
jgi:hypothetical protein